MKIELIKFNGLIFGERTATWESRYGQGLTLKEYRSFKRIRNEYFKLTI